MANMAEPENTHTRTYTLVIHSCALSRNSVRRRSAIRRSSSDQCTYLSALAPIQAPVQQWNGYQQKAATEPFPRWIFASFSLSPGGLFLFLFLREGFFHHHHLWILQYRCVSDYLLAAKAHFFLFASGPRNVFRPSTTPTFTESCECIFWWFSTQLLNIVATSRYTCMFLTLLTSLPPECII